MGGKKPLTFSIISELKEKGVLRLNYPTKPHP
jgi:hypothetical protein